MIKTNHKIKINNRNYYIFNENNRTYIKYEGKFVEIYILQNNIAGKKGGGVDATYAFTYQIRDINNAIEKYEKIFIQRQEKILHLCANFINKIKATESSLNNKFGKFSMSNDYDRSRYLTLINKEFYENIFKKYFIIILQSINKDSIVSEEAELKKIAKYLHFITYDDNEKDKKINKDFKEFEKLGVDDDIDEISLKNNVKNSLNELNDLMATFNVDKKKIIDTVSLKKNVIEFKKKIENWSAPSWQDILLSTFNEDVEYINDKAEKSKGNEKYLNAILNFLSLESSDINNFDEKSMDKIKKDVEKALDAIKELPKEINNETDISELINIVISNIKKLLINLINKNYSKNISSIQKLKDNSKKEIEEIIKHIENYKNDLDSSVTEDVPQVSKVEEEKEKLSKNPSDNSGNSGNKVPFTEAGAEKIRTLAILKGNDITSNDKNLEGQELIDSANKIETLKVETRRGSDNTEIPLSIGNYTSRAKEEELKLLDKETKFKSAMNNILKSQNLSGEEKQIFDNETIDKYYELFITKLKIEMGKSLILNEYKEYILKIKNSIGNNDEYIIDNLGDTKNIKNTEGKYLLRAFKLFMNYLIEIKTNIYKEITPDLIKYYNLSISKYHGSKIIEILEKYHSDSSFIKKIQKLFSSTDITKIFSEDDDFYKTEYLFRPDTDCKDDNKEICKFTKNLDSHKLFNDPDNLTSITTDAPDKKKKNIFETLTDIVFKKKEENIQPTNIQQTYDFSNQQSQPNNQTTNKDHPNEIGYAGGNNKKYTNKFYNLQKSKYKVCGYVTDVEGNMDYFNKYVKISKILEWTCEKKNRLKFKKNDSIFIYGGDTQDRGDSDIRFVNILLKFKEDYPERVIFIIGNRDANKLRIPSEISEKYSNYQNFLKKYDNYPYWEDKSVRITLRKYLKDNNYDLNIKNRLKYIVERTMGNKDGFEKRRVELSIILKKNINNISDNDVISSFLNSVLPKPKNITQSNDNYMLKYLMQGQLVHIFGEHIFVHGAINEKNIGKIPKNKNTIEDIHIWAKEINNWFHKELKEYMKNPKDGGITKKRKAHNIINYAVPGYNKDITIVYADNLKNGNGVHINKNVIEHLNKYGIKNIITGHKPHGDCPLVIRDKNLTAISADTSYSNINYLKNIKDDKYYNDKRGKAVSEVLLYSNGDIRVHGILADNSKYGYIIKKNKKSPSSSDYIGLQLNNNYWVKNFKNNKYLISFGKGFDIDEKWVNLQELKKLLKKL